MIPDHLKNPPTVKISVFKVKKVLECLESTINVKNDQGEINISISKEYFDIISNTLSTMLYILELLKIKKTGILIIRKVLNVFPINKKIPKPIPKPNPDPNPKLSPDPEENKEDIKKTNEDEAELIPLAELVTDDDDDDDDDDHGDESAGSSKNKVGHNSGSNNGGRRGANDVVNPKIIELNHNDYSSGDNCPIEDCSGKLYTHKQNGEVRSVLTFDFSPPIEPIVFKMNDLRCSFCLTVFKINIPDEYAKDNFGEGSRYTYRAQTAISILHYGMGFAFYRLDQFQSFTGERLPPSTQFSIVESVSNVMLYIYKTAIKLVANSPLIQVDDISSRVSDIKPELRSSRSTEKINYRSNTYTSILVATNTEGNLIPIFNTSLKHAGECLDDLLENRDKELGSIKIFGDASKVNSVKNTNINYERGSCWQHFREYVVSALNSFQNEAIPIKELISQIFKIDKASLILSPIDRLKKLQDDALPLYLKIEEFINDYSDKKIALPKSELGKAITYFNNNKNMLRKVFEIIGMPLHNNFIEWCTYWVERLMKNSRRYKTSLGSAVGDILMSSISMAMLNGFNPYEYILYCLTNQDELKKNPQNFLPWNLKDKISLIPKHLKMNFPIVSQ